MPRTITYSVATQVSEPTLNTVRTALHAWHDPANGSVLERLREAPVVESGTQQTNGNGDNLYNVQLRASLTGITDGEIDSSVDTLVTAINSQLPDEWPDATTDDITITSA